MNIIKKYKLYKKLLNTKPVSVVRKDSSGYNFYRIQMEYKIDDENLVVNTFFSSEDEIIELFGYGAQVINKSKKTTHNYYNVIYSYFAKKLYEHGERHL